MLTKIVVLIGLGMAGVFMATPGNAGQMSGTWLTQPTASELDAAYPRLARRAEIEGSALLRCKIASDGRLSGCFVVQETPAGFGFGEAALVLATKFRRSGGKAPLSVDLPIAFRLSEDTNTEIPVTQTSTLCPDGHDCDVIN